MILDFSKLGKFTGSMEKYLDEVLKSLPEDMNGTSTFPAAKHHFKTRDNAVKLVDEQAELCHGMTEQLLFACKRGRPDIQTAILFLCTWVKAPDRDGCKKLTRVIKCIRRKKFICLTMEATHLD
jgi:hypothetical protein